MNGRGRLPFLPREIDHAEIELVRNHPLMRFLVPGSLDVMSERQPDD
jgi:hypothetical protein